MSTTQCSSYVVCVQFCTFGHILYGKSCFATQKLPLANQRYSYKNADYEAVTAELVSTDWMNSLNPLRKYASCLETN